jgi:hypothetical protein
MCEPEAPDDDQLRMLWEETRRRFLSEGDDGAFIHELAGAGEWFASRREDRVADFVALSWEQLHRLRGFGRKKIESLVAVLSAAAPAERLRSPTEAWPEVLARLSIPDEFPLDLVPLPARLLEFCCESKVNTLGDLLRFYESCGGETALLKVRNLGRGTTAVARRLYDAAASGDVTALCDFLPLSPSGGGLHLAEGLVMLLRTADESRRTVLVQRLLVGDTLDAVGNRIGVSRERVRQLEIETLRPAAALLAWFTQECDECFARLAAGEPCAEIFTGYAEPDQKLAWAVIERLFDDSPVGEAFARESEAFCAGWIETLHGTPDFWRGQILLRDWVASHGGERRVAACVEQCLRAGEFSLDEATGRLRPPRRSLKHVAAVFLRHREAIDAEELLSDLRRVEDFSELTLENLRRNYQSWHGWREDPDFPATTVHFPADVHGATLLHNLSAAPKTRLKASAAPPVTQVELPELDACNRLVVGALAASAGVGIIGLLPLATLEQRRVADAVGDAVGDAHGGSVSTLLRLMARYPGAVCYAVALAAGEGMDSREFWPKVSEQLKLELPPVRHPQISQTFRAASITLGLLPPDPRQGNLIWPIIFQAGVVPQFVMQLANAISRQLVGQPPPDAEDVEELHAFTLAIHARVNSSWKRLRDVLDSPAGPCVCAAILRAHGKNDFSLLPPHLARPMRDAFEGSFGGHFAAPRLEFQRAANEVVLHLPQQPRRLVLPTSHWTVGTGKTRPADEPSNLPVASLAAASVQVSLGLRPPYQPWSREVALRPAPGGPPQIFRLPGGRQVNSRAEADGVIRLPAGEYAVVVPSDLASNIAEGWTLLDTGDRWIEYESFPGQIPLEISPRPDAAADASAWKVAPRAEVAITVLADRGGSRLATTTGEWIYYGDELFVSLSVPPEHAAEDEQFEFACTDAGGRLEDRRLTFDGGVFAHEGGGEVDGAWMRQALDALPAGIHVLRLELLSQRCSAQREVVFWKGLLYPKAGWGFYCATPLDNVVLDRSTGVRAAPDGLMAGAGLNTSDIQLVLACPPLCLFLPRPGVTLRLLDAATGEMRPVGHGTTLGFGADDPTRIVVECNDRGRWALLAGHTPVREFPDGTGQFAGRIAGIFHEYGDHVALQMRSPGGMVLPLLTLTRLAMATGFRCDLRPGENCYQGGFRLPEFYAELGLQLDAVLSGGREDDATAPVMPLPLTPGSHELEWAGTRVIAFEVSAAPDGEHIVLFRLVRASLAHGMYLAQFFCRKAGEDAWTPLRVPDPGGSVEARLCFVSHPFTPVANAPALETLLAAAWNGKSPASQTGDGAAVLPATDEATIKECFLRLTGVLTYAYPDAGWRSVKWTRDALTALCRAGVAVCPGELATLAAGELSARSRDNEALYRPLAFGLPELWSLDGSLLRANDLADDLVGRSFATLAALGGGCGLTDFFGKPAGQAVDFSFIVPSLQGQPDSYERCLRDLAKGVFELDGSNALAATLPLLGPDHFCRALHRLDRVARAVTQAGRHVSTDSSGRRAMVTHLLRLDGRLPRLAAFVKERLRMSNVAALDIELYAGCPAPEVRRLLLALTALARLQTIGRVSGAEAARHLEILFGATPADPTPIHKGLSLLVGLGSEFFACTLLFWELVLRGNP